MLVETIVHTAYRLHREGRLEARLLLSLDDLANCAPLPRLESNISQGVNTCWNLQSLAQLRDHFGVEAAEAIWGATRCKLVFGGLADERSLPAGRRYPPGTGREQGLDGRSGCRQWSYSESWRPLLAAADLREIPNGWSLLLYHNLPPHMLRQPLAIKRYQLRRHMLPWTVSQPELRVVEDDLEEVA